LKSKKAFGMVNEILMMPSLSEKGDIPKTQENFLVNLLKDGNSDETLSSLIKMFDIKKDDLLKLIEKNFSPDEKEKLIDTINKIYDKLQEFEKELQNDLKNFSNLKPTTDIKKETKPQNNNLQNQIKTQKAPDNSPLKLETDIKSFPKSPNLMQIFIGKTPEEIKIQEEKETTPLTKKTTNSDDKDKQNILSLLNQKTINIDDLPKYIDKVTNTSPKEEKKEKIVLIKKIILSNVKISNNLQEQKVIAQFKKIDNIKELIDFAKKNLNLKSIVVSKEETIKQPQLNIQNQSKIKPLNVPTKEKPKKTENTKNEVKTTPKNSITLSNILQKKINKTHKTQQSQPEIKLKDKPQEPEFPQITKTTTEEKEPQKHKEKNTDITSTSQTQNVINSKPQIHQKIIEAKQSINRFSSQLKEAIENYKPPLSKVSLELHPKELGKVEVTIIHRGDNLQIHVNGQNQTINFFNQHQQDLKTALVNMGYNEVNMSFNQQQNQQNQQREKYKQQQNSISKEEDEFIIEIPYQYA
jgi:hypothetical protein